MTSNSRSIVETLAMGVVVGLACAADAGAGQPPPLAPLSCGAGQKVVVEMRPLDGPHFWNVRKTDWGGLLGDMMGGFGVGGVAGAASAGAKGPASQDSTGSFGKAVGAVVDPAAVDNTLLAALEAALKGASHCEIAFMTSAERRAAAPEPTARVLVVGLYLDYHGGDPKMTARLGALQFEDAEKLKAMDEMSVRLQEFQAELTKPGKMPSLGKLKEFQKLAESAVALAQGAWNDIHESPSHKTAEWLTDGGSLVTTELDAGLDALVPRLAKALSPSSP
jgi:hypothetical protein